MANQLIPQICVFRSDLIRGAEVKMICTPWGLVFAITYMDGMAGVLDIED